MQTHALDKLASWIAENSQQAQFARDLGIAESHLSNLISGRKRASLDLVERIVLMTKGGVSADDLLSDNAQKTIADARERAEVSA